LRIGVPVQLTGCLENAKIEDRNALLRAVVELDSDRILSRLRSRHTQRSKKIFKNVTTKTPLITQLTETIKGECPEGTAGLPKSGRDRARALQALFTRLERISDITAAKTEVQELIREIVEEAHEFTVATDLQAALEHSRLDPSLKKYLPQAIAKLGRYFSAASDLVCAARDKACRAFKRIHVAEVQIRVPAFMKELSRGPLPIIPEAVAALALGRAEQMERALQRRMAEIVERRKVHAEIQLLFFYELYPESARPRIICSSKSACYLCNLFFHVHGGFHVPRTHGKLYDTWILPDWLEVPRRRRKDLAIITERFKATLDDRIKDILTSKPKNYNHPNESVLLPTGHWSSSVLSGILESTVPDSTSTRGPQPRKIVRTEMTPDKDLA
jgi:hypothetical protein